MIVARIGAVEMSTDGEMTAADGVRQKWLPVRERLLSLVTAFGPAISN